MADTKGVAAPAEIAAPAEVTARAGEEEPINLRSGTYTYGGYTEKIRSPWTFVGKEPKKPKEKKKLFIEKTMKNGEKRLVSLIKKKQAYPTMDGNRKRPAKKGVAKVTEMRKPRLRPSLVPGKIVILLTGAHKGRHAVFLKQLPSGSLLVTGPHCFNRIPLRRVHQKYVITTSTQLDLSNVEIPSKIDDAYFKRNKPKKIRKKDGDIFVAKKQKFRTSEERKADQKIVDKQIVSVIRKMEKPKLMRSYLNSLFGLQSTTYPHRMKF